MVHMKILSSREYVCRRKHQAEHIQKLSQAVPRIGVKPRSFSFREAATNSHATCQRSTPSVTVAISSSVICCVDRTCRRRR